MRRLAQGALLLVLALGASGPDVAHAQPGMMAVTPDRSLSFGARTVLGETTVQAAGDELYISITNTGDQRREGTIDLSTGNWLADASPIETAHYSVAAKAFASVHMPVNGDQPIVVTARDSSGRAIFQATLQTTAATVIRVVDVEDLSRISPAIGTTSLDPEYSLASGYTSYTTAPVLLQIRPCGSDRETGDPLLPQYQSGWIGAQMALIKSDVLAHLSGAELSALEGFVLGGGTIAVVVTHAEDLAQPTLLALVGGRAERTSPTHAMLTELGISSQVGGPARWPVAPRNPADTTEVSGYAGGNLEASAFGATATYGLGQVVLLGFDPTTTEGSADPWVQIRIADLARRAYERQSTMVFGPGSPPVRPYPYGNDDSLRDIRRELDPNQNARFAIGIATVLLCIYALIAGPFAFWRARKQNRPLRALWALPILSALMFFVVVGIGLFSRGASSRSRRLTFVDAGAGMSRGVAHRFRGFFSAVSTELTVTATDRTSVFNTERQVTSGDVESGTLTVVDRDGVRLERVAAIPWQTVLVQEHGMATIGEGISVSPSESGSADVIVKNRTGKRLRAVLIKLPNEKFRFAHELGDGERVDTRDLSPNEVPTSWVGSVEVTTKTGRADVHRLNLHWLTESLSVDSPDIASAWVAAGSTVQTSVDWFPRDVPVVLAAFDGGDGRDKDAGIKIDSDRTLLRVVGWGGEP